MLVRLFMTNVFLFVHFGVLLLGVWVFVLGPVVETLFVLFLVVMLKL